MELKELCHQEALVFPVTTFEPNNNNKTRKKKKRRKHVKDGTNRNSCCSLAWR